MTRQLGRLAPALLAVARGVCSTSSASGLQALVLPAFKLTQAVTSSMRSLHTSLPMQMADVPSKAPSGEVQPEPRRKYRPLQDKELWHEAWMYEDKFGTAEDPTLVPCLGGGERMIGVTDPEDENIVIWGILQPNNPPIQFVEGGEYYQIIEVPYITKVGDVLAEIESGAGDTKELPK